MSIFSRKEEVNLEDFCRDFYDNQILNPKIGVVKASNVFSEFFKERIVEASPEFKDISLQKIEEEITILRFELFALAWIHSFGEKLAVDQSIFTKKYLHEKDRDDIWTGMGEYSQAIANSVTSRRTESNEVNIANIIRMRIDLYDKYTEDIEKNTGMPMPADGIGLGLAINRILSEKAWEKGTTSYFLAVVLCRRFGLSYGKNSSGPSKEGQFRLMTFIKGFYDGAQQSWDKVEINR